MLLAAAAAAAMALAGSEVLALASETGGHNVNMPVDDGTDDPCGCCCCGCCSDLRL